MNERIEVGYICTKGNGGHFSLAGESDYGVCGSHIGGRIYIESEDSCIDLEQQANSLADWVARAEKALDAEYWSTCDPR